MSEHVLAAEIEENGRTFVAFAVAVAKSWNDECANGHYWKAQFFDMSDPQAAFSCGHRHRDEAAAIRCGRKRLPRIVQDGYFDHD